ncbi:alcohol dehydrogenase catalytic domain-containing protein [Seohaeicola zhoushanensis]
MTNMKAVELRPAHGGGGLSIASRPVPKPGRGEVLVRVRAASLNFRDLLVADHMYGALPETVVPLSDGAGEIAALGEGVSGLVPGQRVAGAFTRTGSPARSLPLHAPGRWAPTWTGCWRNTRFCPPMPPFRCLTI